MRAQVYPDGTKRINAKIEIPMTYGDIAEYIMSAISQNVVTLDQVQELNKRELLRVAKGEIRTLGVDAPLDNVERVERDTQVIVNNYVKRMFPELM